MNTFIDYYRFSGNPAIATIIVNGIPNTGDTLTIGGVAFTMNVDVYVPTSTSGTPARGAFQGIAEAICAAINCDKARSEFFDIGVHNNPFRPFYAMYYGNIIRLAVSNPGILGSTIPMSTSNSGVFQLSGASFAGGGEGAATGAGDASASNQVTAIAAIQALVNKTLDTSAAARVSSPSPESGRILKGSAGRLILCTGYNNGPAQFIQIFNSTTVPADGAQPAWLLKVNAAANFSFVCPTTGVPFTTGIAVSNSTTFSTKTFGGNDCMFTAVVL